MQENKLHIKKQGQHTDRFIFESINFHIFLIINGIMIDGESYFQQKIDSIADSRGNNRFAP